MSVVADPRAGLVIADFETGGPPQLIAVATVDWDGVEARRRPGALRQIEIGIDTVVGRDGTGQSWQLQSYSADNLQHRPT
jgi:hypothetical protein